MGGVILRHAGWDWHVMSLCRADDPDREPRFRRASIDLGAVAYISDLDDSPILASLSPDLEEIKSRIVQSVAPHFDLVFTHGARGEYTRHERHEQVHRAVREMVQSGRLSGELLYFAYENRGGECRPRPAPDAHLRVNLSPDEYLRKLAIVRDIYGFPEGSFEYGSAGQAEAFRAESESKAEDLQILLEIAESRYKGE